MVPIESQGSKSSLPTMFTMCCQCVGMSVCWCVNVCACVLVWVCVCGSVTGSSLMQLDPKIVMLLLGMLQTGNA